jgi:hypothetical protein
VLITGVEGTTLIVWPADGRLPIDGAPGPNGGPSVDGGQEQS